MQRALLLVAILAAGCHERFERDKLDAIVAAVRARSLPPGDTELFRVDDNLEASTLTLLPANVVLGRGDNRGLVRAERDGAHVAVSIETRDDGHAGEYGFCFFDGDARSPALENVLHSATTEELGDHWTRWSYNLD